MTYEQTIDAISQITNIDCNYMSYEIILDRMAHVAVEGDLEAIKNSGLVAVLNKFVKGEAKRKFQSRFN